MVTMSLDIYHPGGMNQNAIPRFCRHATLLIPASKDFNVLTR